MVCGELRPLGRIAARDSHFDVAVFQAEVDHVRGGFDQVEDFPHVLVRWERADGTVYALRNVVRLPYWKYTHAGDRKLLEEPHPVRQQANP